jgi:hypothetical protein
MQIVRGQQSHQSKQWDVKTSGNDYRVICYWSGGELRMTWLVEASTKLRSGERGWRRIKGLSLINAVREFENQKPNIS